MMTLARATEIRDESEALRLESLARGPQWAAWAEAYKGRVQSANRIILRLCRFTDVPTAYASQELVSG